MKELLHSGDVVVPVMADARSLIEFADSVLPTLRTPSGLYCFDRSFGSPQLRGESLRYSLMVALGTQRASAHGYDVSAPTRPLIDLVLARREELTVGDLGLAIWALSRDGDERARSLVAGLDPSDAATARLPGMEIAWVVIGAVAAIRAGISGSGRLLDSALRTLRARRSATSPLFHHTGAGRRAALPNFATQVYALLALAEVASLGDDTAALPQACSLADHLLASRDADGGWPWLFHADRGDVVERYEVYSVHQDAMAPMAFFALADAAGERSYATEAARSLRWCFGQNELGVCFYDVCNRFAHRSIRRRGTADRFGLYGNTAASLAGISWRVDLGEREVNQTCRPYHLGWIMEAWAGRESFANQLAVVR